MDGTASAWVANKKYGDTAEYIAADNWNVLPEYVTNHKDISNVEIYVIDFSFSKEVLLDLQDKCKKLVILDHHVGAKENIESVREHVYGEGESGCMLAWKYFFPDIDIPLAIQYVSDSDTWTHEMPDYEIVDAYIYKTDNDFTINYFQRIVDELSDEKRFQEVKKIGKVLREAYLSTVNKYLDRAEEVEFAGYKVLAVNAPSEIKSELGHKLAEKTGTFGIIYYYFEGKWRFSLRSVDDFDVSEIAKKLGGGGHKNAAAFHIPFENPITSILKTLK